MKKLRKREFRGEHAMEIIKFKKEKMQSLTKKLQKSYENAKICYICKKNVKINMLKIKNVIKLDTIIIIQGNIEVLRMSYVI